MGRNLDRGFEGRNETHRNDYGHRRNDRSDNIKRQTRDAIYNNFKSGGKKSW